MSLFPKHVRLSTIAIDHDFRLLLFVPDTSRLDWYSSIGVSSVQKIILWFELYCYLKNKLKYRQWAFQNNVSFHFRWPFYDDVTYKDDWYFWSNEELKIKLKYLDLTLVKFWNLFAIKCLLQNNSTRIRLLSLIRQPGG